MWILFVLLFICGGLLLVYEASRWLHAAFALVFVGLFSLIYPGWLAWPLIVVALFIACVVLVDPMRQMLVSGPVLKIFRKVKPRLSATEQAALDAGDVWWDGELFSGRPQWERLLATPPASLSAEEQAFVDGPVEELCQKLDDWQIYHELHDLPPEVWQSIKQSGLFGMIIPKRYGGLELSAMANSAVITKLAARSLTAAVTVMVPNSLGPAELLLHYGTKEQQDNYLPRLATGEEIPCFALTGPQAGSDAASIPDCGVVCHGDWQGQQVVGIRLNWEKRYITLGPVATVLGLAFQLDDPDQILSDQQTRGITCALIPTDTAGIEIGTRHNPLNVPFQVGPNWGRDVFIPLEMVIGGEQGIGQGWKMLMNCLAAGRAVSLPALSTGAAKLVTRYSGAYARVRRQFGLPIGRFEGVEERLAVVAGTCWQMDAARRLTCAAIDQGAKPAVISALVKQNLTEKMRLVVNHGMDIEGGKAICLGPKNHIGHAYQGIPIGITVEGANILTRSMIIFGQGSIRCHPWVLKEMAAADLEGKEAVVAFDQAFFGHVLFSLRNAVSALFYGLTAGYLIGVPDSSYRRWYQCASRFSTAFVFTSDVLMATFGGGLKLREKLTGRMADILSELYLISAVLKYGEERGCPDDEQSLVEWSCRTSLRHIQTTLLEIFDNLPSPLGWLLRALIFPVGAHFKGPSDQLGHKVAAIILAPGPVRDRLTEGLAEAVDEADPLAQLENALHLAVAADPLEKKLRDAVKLKRLTKRELTDLQRAVDLQIITDIERELLIKARQARDQVIQVDAF